MSTLTPDVYTETDRPYTPYRVLYLTVDHDSDAPNPIDPDDRDGVWTVTSFDSRSGRPSNRFQFLDDLVTDDPDEDQTEMLVLSDDIRDKLSVGLAFMLARRSDDWTINSHSTDLYTADGIMVWNNDPSDMGAKTYADRQQDAQGELTEYNAWCNGDCWEYTLHDENGQHLTEEDVHNTLYGDYLTEHILTQEVQPFMKRHGLTDFDYITLDTYTHTFPAYRPVYRPGMLYVYVSGDGAYNFSY